MKINRQNIAEYLKNLDFERLFINELGWDNVQLSPLPVKLTEEDSNIYTFSPIAHKRGMIAYLYQDTDKPFPDYPARRKLERKVAKSAHEHIIIFLDKTENGTTVPMQIWQWVKTEAGKPNACREHKVHEKHSGEALIQKLENIAIPLDEEENLTLIDITNKTKKAFDVEKVTKKFYERFKKEHDNFLEFIKGIPDGDDEQWYASIMLNRLMFTYFIQKKGFLDGDPHYLRNRLDMVQQAGKEKFYSFYKSFLRELFHQGLNKKKADRTAETNQLIGEIPYLNGGIFQEHELEGKYKDIEVDDNAFKSIFDFFDEYDWHLDERPLHNDNEINPDVLGYIFEKYINQKQMGAYYTKEDITGYISRNTILPRLFDMAKEKCKIAFDAEQAPSKKSSSVWDLLHENPERYIYPAVRHGISYDIHNNCELSKPHELPDNITIGLNASNPNLLERRKDWNQKAPEDFALPTEIWREVIARRQRYEEIWLKLAGGEITDINDLITYNLDICQFAQDVIESSEGPELVRAFYRSIEKITILDPTCGSGAFLFAALNILEPLYEACIDRMEWFVKELEESKEHHRPEKYSDFKEILANVAKHPSPRYFIYKSIILNNLYGVDIMDEAVEICKLRLFLKLMAQAKCDRSKDNMGVEALPDVDFNVRAGNSLVGFANYAEVKQAVEGKDQGMFDFDNTMDSIDEKAETVDRAYKLFRQMQTQQDISSAKFANAKADLRQRLSELEDELNGYLAKEYGVDPSSLEYPKWKESHKPFHWYVDFYGIIHGNKGFDVIIGNPPYVEYRKVSQEYKVQNLLTSSCGNLFAYVLEKSFHLKSKCGLLGMIVPVSSVSSNRMHDLQSLLKKQKIWSTSYSNRPGKLFKGVEQRLSILIINKNEDDSYYSNSYLHWYSNERNILFNKIFYDKLSYKEAHLSIGKIGNNIYKKIIDKIFMRKEVVATFKRKETSHKVYFHDGPTYWIRAANFMPNEGMESDKSNHYKEFNAVSNKIQNVIFCLLNSSIFYLYFKTFSNCRDFSSREVDSFPLGQLDATLLNELKDLANNLATSYVHNRQIKTRTYPSGNIDYYEYYPLKSKDLIDEIDKVLAQHYGFTEEELDYIINYDIKYRMGKELNE